MKKTILVLVLLSLIFSALTAFADDSKISPDLRGYTSTRQVPVIVQYAPGAQNNCRSLLGLVLCLTGDILRLGGSILNELPLVNSVVATLDAKGILSLSNNPSVVYISKDRPLQMLMSNATPAVNAQVAWKAKYTGGGIAVALIDSGVNSHRDLKRVVWNQSFIKGSWSTADQYGHGTHIAGLISGTGASSTGAAYSKTFKGIAPDASIINFRVLDENGRGTDSAVIAAIHQAILLKPLFNIRVINLSLGRGVFESYDKDPLCRAVEKAWKAGIVVVVSAGNLGRFESTNGYDTITSPANDPYVITVGSMKPMGTPTRTDDQIASYSSKGPTWIDRIVKPDVVAPGNLLVSTETSNTTLYASEPSNRVPYNYYVFGGSSAPSTSYFSLSGTSMAAGVVSGIVADLLDANPRLTPDQVKARLMRTATKNFPKSSSVYDPVTGNTYVSQYDLFTVGAGYVDLAAALANTDVFYGTAMSPTAVFDAKYNFRLARDRSSGWQAAGPWSAPSVYGPSQFNSGGSVMWSATDPTGGSVMWSATNSSDFSANWGTSVMWSATDPTGGSVMWSATNPDGTSVMWSAGTNTGE